MGTVVVGGAVRGHGGRGGVGGVPSAASSSPPQAVSASGSAARTQSRVGFMRSPGWWLGECAPHARHGGRSAGACAKFVQALRVPEHVRISSRRKPVPRPRLPAPTRPDARNTITRAISAGGVHASCFASGMAARLAGVSMVPGSTALARTRPLYSSAMASVSVSSAALETAYGTCPLRPLSAARDETKTSDPPSASRGMAARAIRKALRRLMDIIRSQSSTAVSCSGAPPAYAADGVHHRVQPPAPVGRPRHRLARARLRRQVRGEPGQAVRMPAAEGLQRVRAAGGVRGDGDAPSVRQECFRDGAPQPAGPAGDQHDALHGLPR